MKAAMGTLALLSIAGGVVAIPGVTESLEHFLEPTFEESAFIEEHPSTGAEVLGLVIGGAIAIIGIGLAWAVYLRRPGVTLELRDRFSRVHDFLAHKWYFDELYDALLVRPTATFGRIGRHVIESALVQGVIVGGATGVVRAGTSLARAVQSGYIRSYALLLLMGMTALALYFLIVSS